MLVLKTKYQKLSRIAFAPDGRGLAAAGRYGAYWWPSFFDDPAPVRFGETLAGGAGFTPGGGHLVTVLNGTGLCAIDLAERTPRAAPVAGFEPAASVCPASGLVVVESVFGWDLSGWRVGADGTPERVWAVNAGPGSIGSAVAFAPDGSWFVRAGREPGAGRGYQLVLRDPGTGEPVRSCPGADWVSSGPAVSPDGGWVAFASANSVVAQSVENPRDRHTARNDNTHQFTGLAFHPSGRVLAVTNNDATVKLLDTATWAVARTFTWNIGKMRSVAFSPDGTLAAAGSDTGKVVVWDVDL